VYTFFSTCLSTCVASPAWVVFGFVFITTFLFSCSLFFEFNRYLCHGALNVRLTLLLCLSPFSICLFIMLIPAYVYLNMCMHLPTLLFSCTSITIFLCMFCVMFYIHTHRFVLFFLFPILNGCLCYGVDSCNHTPSHILILRSLLYFHFVICISTIVWSLCLP